MEINESLYTYCLRLADNNLILGQRLAEWCGHGPILEEDIALTNIALDLIGQARSLYTYAAELEGKGKTEDDLAYFRNEREFKNVLLVEQKNGNYADTIARSFYYDCWNYFFLKELANTNNEFLKGFADKSIKEVSYHLRHSSEWLVRLGDGTEESHKKMSKAVQSLYRFSGELFEMDEVDQTLLTAGIGVDMAVIKEKCNKRMAEVLEEATIALPVGDHFTTGGRKGVHSEHLGFILAEMQSLQRSIPGQEW